MRYSALIQVRRGGFLLRGRQVSPPFFEWISGGGLRAAIFMDKFSQKLKGGA